MPKALSSLSYFLFFFRRLPTLAFWNVAVPVLGDNDCSVSLKYSWFTKNPFKSVYFAALAGVAELSTGLLIFYHMKHKKNVSYLVTKVEGEFLKKAKGRITFSCNDGHRVFEVLQHLNKENPSATLLMHSGGFDTNGVQVARFTFLWSFKIKL